MNSLRLDGQPSGGTSVKLGNQYEELTVLKEAPCGFLTTDPRRILHRMHVNQHKD